MRNVEFSKDLICSIKICFYAPKGSFIVSAAKGRGDIIVKIRLFLLQCFSRFLKSSANGSCFCSSCWLTLLVGVWWWVSGEVEKSYLIYLGNVFIYTFYLLMSWLILQNDRQFPGLGKAGLVLCKISRGK